MVRKFTRTGVYGVILREGEVYLCRKTAGPFKDRWDFPGGKIEHGETPQEALKRELLEEAAFDGEAFELVDALSCHGEHKEISDHYKYHHIGIIYRIGKVERRMGLMPEEEGRWFKLDELRPEEMTPFVEQILSQLLHAPKP